MTRAARRAPAEGRRRLPQQPRRTSCSPARCRASTRSRRSRTFSAAYYHSSSRRSARRRSSSRTRTSGCSCRTSGGRARRPDDQRRHPLRPAVAVRAGSTRCQQRVAAARRRLRARQSAARSSARAAASTSIAFRCARRPTRCSATASKYQSGGAVVRTRLAAPAFPTVLPSFPPDS